MSVEGFFSLFIYLLWKEIKSKGKGKVIVFNFIFIQWFLLSVNTKFGKRRKKEKLPLKKLLWIFENLVSFLSGLVV